MLYELGRFVPPPKHRLRQQGRLLPEKLRELLAQIACMDKARSTSRMHYAPVLAERSTSRRASNYSNLVELTVQFEQLNLTILERGGRLISLPDAEGARAAEFSRGSRETPRCRIF